MPKNLSYAKALETPVEEWKSTGNIRNIHQDAYDILQRCRQTYQDYHGGKKPRLEQALTWLILENSDCIISKLEAMEQAVADRQAAQL